MALPTKLHIPPSMRDPLDIAYAEGWNAVCAAFLNAPPPQEPPFITIKREVVRPAETWQPFETAPTEPGVSFLVCFPARRNKYHVAINMNGFRVIGGVFDFDYSDQPTMWMPITPAE